MKKIILPLFGVVAVVAFFSIFIVKEVNQAIVLQFGDPKKIITKPGLNFKLPFIQNVVFLDKVSDPGNMGTIIRTAAWFGVYQIALSPGCIDPYNPKVVRSAMGSHFSLNWMGEKDISTLNNYKLIGADQNSKNKKLDKLMDKWALIMGSESHGFSKKTRSYIYQTIGITKIGSGESLNIGVAMGILLHKMTK